MYKENWNEVDRTDIEAYIGPEMKTSPVYGMQTQVGQTFARHMQHLFVSHVNKFTK